MEQKNTISYLLNTYENSRALKLYYIHNYVNTIDYDIELITRNSNLGFGLIWYFVCSITQKSM